MFALRYPLALTLIKGVGAATMRRIIGNDGNAEWVFSASDNEVEQCVGKRLTTLIRQHQEEALNKADRLLQEMESLQWHIYYIGNEDYPNRLHRLVDAPFFLYSSVDIAFDSRPVVAVVGSRKATEYGRNLVEKLVVGLKEVLPSAIIVSGLAYGIDITAHRMALKHGLTTWAVLGLPINNIYPRQHTRDAQSILDSGGVLMSEYNTMDAHEPSHFVYRNRIIAALSDCVVVVESAEGGGSLYTAAYAKSYGREVMAFPGRISDINSEGCNRLIAEGDAHLITSATDLVDIMNWQTKQPTAVESRAPIQIKLTAVQQKVVDLLRQAAAPMSIHSLQLATSMDIAQLRVLLIQLSLQSVISQLPGDNYEIK